MKLNTIALLKTAGLSLAQIREVTCTGAGEPTLQQILAIQLGTWKRRRTDAQRAEAIAEAALGRLRADQSLSIIDGFDWVDQLVDHLRMRSNATFQLPYR